MVEVQAVLFGGAWMDWGVEYGKIPLWVKVLYTAFVAVLVPVYWKHYGPANFLWFSDLALLLAVPALWMESSFLASTQALSVTLLETLWTVDFLVRLLGGKQLLGISRYMFEPQHPLWIRGLSLFHLGMPVCFPWLLWVLGYDPWALPAQTGFAWVVLLVCHFGTDPAENINWVFGLRGDVQKWMPSWLYLILLMALLPLCVYVPSHFLFRGVFPTPPP